MICLKQPLVACVVLLGVLFFSSSSGTAATNVCYECHDRTEFKNKITHKPVAEDHCISCHNPHAAKHSGLLKNKVSALCFSCHEDQKKSRDRALVQHAPVREGKCTICHDPHASPSKGLMKGAYSDSCFGCHETLARNYKNTHSPFAKGQCNACHAPHQADNYQLLIDSDAKICRTCHSSEEINQNHKNYPATITSCLSCHDPHGSKNKALIRNVMHAPFAKGCNSCHQTGKKDISKDICLACHKEIEEQLLTSHSHLTSISGNNCIACHTPHAGSADLLLKSRQAVICRSCHQDTIKKHENTAFVHAKSVKDCNTCHEVHGSNELAMLKGDGNTVCMNCHETQGQFTHPVGEAIKDPRNRQMISCVTCHTPHGSNFKGALKLSGDQDLCVQCHHM